MRVLGRERRKGRRDGGVLGDVAMDANFWAGENHQLRGFYLARMRQGKHIRGPSQARDEGRGRQCKEPKSAMVRRRAEGAGEWAWTR